MKCEILITKTQIEELYKQLQGHKNKPALFLFRTNGETLSTGNAGIIGIPQLKVRGA